MTRDELRDGSSPLPTKKEGNVKIISVESCFRCPRFRICPIKEGCACEAVSPERVEWEESNAL